MYKQLSNNLEDNFKYIKFDPMKDFIRDTTNGKIPKSFPLIRTREDLPTIESIYFDIKNSDDRFSFISEMSFSRDVYNNFCSWPIVTNDWISELAQLLQGKKCIEIMAGNGLISYALQRHGIDIIAYDNYDWSVRHPYTTIYNMDAVECASRLDYDYIICSWPPYDEFDICRVVQKMYYKKPNAKLIYIGENAFGCNAPDIFFEIVDKVDTGSDAAFISKANECFTNFYGIHDSIYLFKPNNKVKARKFK